jgi:hypothetical protein
MQSLLAHVAPAAVYVSAAAQRVGSAPALSWAACLLCGLLWPHWLYFDVVLHIPVWFACIHGNLCFCADPKWSPDV